MKFNEKNARIIKSLPEVTEVVEGWKKQELYVDWVDIHHCEIEGGGAGQAMAIAARHSRLGAIIDPQHLLVLPAMSDQASWNLAQKLGIPRWSGDKINRS